MKSVQFSCSVVSWLFVTPWTAALQASLSITNQAPIFNLLSALFCHELYGNLNEVTIFGCLKTWFKFNFWLHVKLRSHP